MGPSASMNARCCTGDLVECGNPPVPINNGESCQEDQANVEHTDSASIPDGLTLCPPNILLSFTWRRVEQWKSETRRARGEFQTQQ